MPPSRTSLHLQVRCAGEWRRGGDLAVPALPLPTFDPHRLCALEPNCGPSTRANAAERRR